MSRQRRLVCVAIALVLVGAVAGCRKSAPKVTSPWPVAESERIVKRPPTPLRYPFTGEKAKNRAALRKRPISVKIENSPQSRPQTGLNRADVVYETISEGGITRFNCIFQSDIPPRVGPVRSARLSDLWVVPQYNALFFFSGASSTVNGRIRAAKLPNLSEDAGVSAPYARSTTRSAPHNLYLDTTKAYPTAEDRGYKVTVSDLAGLQYAKRAIEATEVIGEVTIPFSDANTVRWVYKSGSGTYQRFNNGRPHVDEATGDQVETENVVVLWAPYEAASHDKVGSTTYRINLGSKGRCSVFRGGHRFDGTWIGSAAAPPRFIDKKKRPIRLAPGSTWFQVIPLNGMITLN